MKLIVGLGNPGKEFKGTRHNVGYEVIDVILKHNRNFSRQKKFLSYIFCGKIKDQKIILLKPLTFMNLSGESVAKVVNFFKIPPEEVLVVCDDFNLPVGKIRMRSSGSSGGHKGIASIITHLKSNNFWRCRIGIRSEHFLKFQQAGKISEFVLGKFEKDEKEIIKKVVEKVAETIGQKWQVMSCELQVAD